jgi:uncharacterized protein YbaP (TraB family)
MHIRDNRVYRFCEVVYPLIGQADVYVGEMDLSEVPGDPGVGKYYSMRSFFRPAVYEKIRHQLLKSFSIDINRYEHLHPLMIMSAITQHFMQQDHLVSLDEHLWDYAKTQQMETWGLESMDEQVAYLHKIVPEPLYKQLHAISRHPSKFKRFGDKTLQYYLDNKLHALYAMTKSSMHELRKMLIYQRNVRMAERIKTFPPGRKYFITVGAGHLSGSRGLISLLRKAGYIIKPVRSHMDGV